MRKCVVLLHVRLRAYGMHRNAISEFKCCEPALYITIGIQFVSCVVRVH